MCFSNLPVEFDEEGNPYLAEEADDVERPGGGHVHADGCGCTAVDVEVSSDPEAAYEAILESLPAEAREHVDGRRAPRRDPDADPGSAESD